MNLTTTVLKSISVYLGVIMNVYQINEKFRARANAISHLPLCKKIVSGSLNRVHEFMRYSCDIARYFINAAYKFARQINKKTASRTVRTGCLNESVSPNLRYINASRAGRLNALVETCTFFQHNFSLLIRSRFIRDIRSRAFQGFC